MTTIYIGIGVFLVFGAVMLIKGLRRLWRRRLVWGSLQSLSGMLFIAVALLAISIAMNLYSYQAFTDEQLAAEVRIEALGPQYYRVYFIPRDQPAQLFELRGDEWQVDARILKWHGVATLAGLKTVYRFERISGRYRDLKQQRSGQHSVHALASDDGLDLWGWSRKNQQRIPWVDAIYGNAAYMPLTNQAQYKISISSSGLVIRPANSAAQQAIESWK